MTGGTEYEAASAGDRERRFWKAAIAVGAAIYATLGLAGSWADELQRRNVLDAAFGMGVLAIGMSVVAVGVGRRPGGREIGLALGVVAVYVLLLVRLGIAERTHLVEYSILALIVHAAFIERSKRIDSPLPPALLAVLMTVLVGTIDEGIQLLLPNRVFDPIDVAFNALAAVLAVGATCALRAIQVQRS